MIYRTALVICLSFVLAGARQVSADDSRTVSPELRDKVNRAIELYSGVLVNTRDNNPWEVFHAIIGQGINTQVSRNGPGGEPVTAVGWLCFNGRCGGDTLLTWDNGRLSARKGPRVQGHHGQFMAILAQVHVMPDYPLECEGRKLTLADLVESEKLGCRSQTELTFKLIGLSHYLPSDARWKSDDGADWSISRLIREEIAQPILRTAPCGGTHRLMGLAYANKKRVKQGLPIDGEFKRAEKYLNDYHAYAFRLQNPDGSFSTSWFEGPGSRPDIARRLQTSGHILEWLLFSLPKEQLDDPGVVKAVDYLAGIMVEHHGRTWEIGPLGHSLHALRIYRERMFPESKQPQELARKTASLEPPVTIDTDVEKVSLEEVQATDLLLIAPR
jgi:hypothetical protein